jgi:putative transposase
VLSQMILFGERALRHVLSEYIAHYCAERPHQGKGTRLGNLQHAPVIVEE